MPRAALNIWGYDTFNLWDREEAEEGNFDEPATMSFLFELAEFIAPFDELDIRTVGFEKCRFPVLASRYVVRPGEVLYSTLDQHLDYVEPPRHSVVPAR